MLMQSGGRLADLAGRIPHRSRLLGDAAYERPTL